MPLKEFSFLAQPNSSAAHAHAASHAPPAAPAVVVAAPCCCYIITFEHGILLT
jgi:hypothetical protein